MYYFYMGSVLLPISPESFSLKVKNANKTLTLINEGEINILRDAGLTELDFKVLIPAVQYSFAKYDDGFKRPSYYLDYFEKLKTSKQPFQFIVSRYMPDGKMLFDTNMRVSLEDYKVDEKSQEGFDLVVSISLKQYKYYGTKIVTVTDGIANVTNQRETGNAPSTGVYIVKEGDTLWSIAKTVYGDGSMYSAISEANGNVSNNAIQEGQELTIPDADSVKKKPAAPALNLNVSLNAGNMHYHPLFTASIRVDGKPSSEDSASSMTVKNDGQTNVTMKNSPSFAAQKGDTVTIVPMAPNDDYVVRIYKNGKVVYKAYANPGATATYPAYSTLIADDTSISIEYERLSK